MATVDLASSVGISLVAVALIAVFLSPYRRWLTFMFAGMAFWGLLEAIRIGLQTAFELSMTYSYLVSISFLIVVVTSLLIVEDRRAERALARRRYIEHTPIYEDE